MYVTVNELINVPGMPNTPAGIRYNLAKCVGEHPDMARRRQGSKAIEYHVDCLPPETRQALIDRRAQQLLLAEKANAATGEAEGVTLEQLRPDVERTIRDAMARIAPGQPLIRSNIETLISLLPGVTDRTIVTPAANVIAQVDGKRLEWLLPGVISVRDK